MTLEQLRMMRGYISDGINPLAQGAEQLIRQLEVYEARGGADAVAALKAESDAETLAEIERIEAFLSDAAPLIVAIDNDLMQAGSDLRERLMRLRADA